jgi:hypothetical protein
VSYTAGNVKITNGNILKITNGNIVKIKNGNIVKIKNANVVKFVNCTIVHWGEGVDECVLLLSELAHSTKNI